MIFSCGGGGDEDSPIVLPPDPNPIENKAPSIPTLSEPTDNLLCIDNNLAFKWNTSTDPEGDAVKYVMEIATDNQFSQITNSYTNLTTNTKTALLTRDTAYYWRVKAVDSKNASSAYSSVFKFYTEGYGVENHLPFSPTLIGPELDDVTQGTSASLIWGATDVDNDALTFDVYLDTANPPNTIIATNHPQKTITAASLLATTTYYWKVVSKDDKGGVSVGQIWSFKTE